MTTDRLGDTEAGSGGQGGATGRTRGEGPSSGASFLGTPIPSEAGERLYADDLEGLGYVMNLSRLWAHQPAARNALVALLDQVAHAGSLTFRQRGILITACASALGDSYCSLAWGTKLAGEAGAELASGVLRGDDDRLEPAERTLAEWARQVARDPNGTRASDVEALHQAGFDDPQILAITIFVALRLAFSTVNDALGVRPDHAFETSAPASVRDAVTYGRPIAAGDA